MKILPRILVTTGLLLFAGIHLNLAHALDSDKDAPVAIDADTTSIDFRTGQRILTGNVVVNQGTLSIKADKIVLLYKGDAIDTATAFGKPVRFKQLPEGHKEMVHGEGRKLVMEAAKDIITVTENAKLTQGNNTVTGKVIVYNMKTSKMTVKGQSSSKQKATADTKAPGETPDTGTKTGSGRTRIVIEPGKLK